MTDRLHIAALVGSLRSASFNRSVADAASTLLGPGVTSIEIDLSDIPLYDGDIESRGDPAAVVAMKEVVDKTDGLIIFTPEYNRSVPAVTKNAVDWLSRLPGSSVLSRATVGIVAATPGGHDGAGVRAHLAQSVAANTDRLLERSLGIARISENLTDGVLTDQHALGELADWLNEFQNYIKETISV